MDASRMYERLTKWIPTMRSYEGGSSTPSWMWPPEFSEFLDDLLSFSCPFGGKCLEPEEIWLAAEDKEFLDSLEGAVIIAAMRDVFGADRIVEGTVNKFANAGVFHRFLVRLKELDEGKPIVKPKKEYAYHKRAEAKRQEEAVKQEAKRRLEAEIASKREKEERVRNWKESEYESERLEMIRRANIESFREREKYRTREIIFGAEGQDPSLFIKIIFYAVLILVFFLIKSCVL